MKATIKELTLKFVEGVNMGEVMDMTGRVLVGRVHGRAYFIDRLRVWVKEIWGNIFKDLLEVKTLAQGWFALYFH